jgi:pimeloyl-ACP methyl ester carboxylesterase
MPLGFLIDSFEECAARRDDFRKVSEPVVIGASLAFANAKEDASLRILTDLVAGHAGDATFYAAPPCLDRAYAFDGRVLRFPSAIVTETIANNTVFARVREAEGSATAVLILPHWNAPVGAYRKLALILEALGLTSVEMVLPYHGPRNRSNASLADHFVSPNLGRTIRATRQGVLDTRMAIDWLAARGYRRFALVGISMGSCVAGLVAAHDLRVAASALLLTGGDFAEVVWTSRATRHIKQSLVGNLTLDQLRGVWSIISVAPYAQALARPGHRTLVLSGARDRIALPILTAQLCAKLELYGADYRWCRLPCGHYSLGVFPFNAITATALAGFFSKELVPPAGATALPLSWRDRVLYRRQHQIEPSTHGGSRASAGVESSHTGAVRRRTTVRA